MIETISLPPMCLIFTGNLEDLKGPWTITLSNG